ncbi:hypothetical protein PoB_007069600 [Plakobranchus ocellatus]|uniref:PITH domain-containing protein n=1 Tax=Plakobranchus ocellatus TaxID=259542 RepID=A0AAV4DJZ0_9GAST|nr:hypothetical protein PoB_007069600 [Plakobranchus ocellatus]
MSLGQKKQEEADEVDYTCNEETPAKGEGLHGNGLSADWGPDDLYIDRRFQSFNFSSFEKIRVIVGVYKVDSKGSSASKFLVIFYIDKYDSIDPDH